MVPEASQLMKLRAGLTEQANAARMSMLSHCEIAIDPPPILPSSKAVARRARRPGAGAGAAKGGGAAAKAGLAASYRAGPSVRAAVAARASPAASTRARRAGRRPSAPSSASSWRRR